MKEYNELVEFRNRLNDTDSDYTIYEEDIQLLDRVLDKLEQLKDLPKKICEEIRNDIDDYCVDDIFLFDKFIENLDETQKKFEAQSYEGCYIQPISPCGQKKYTAHRLIKNETFKCEICGCKTPIECEGSEPNTCEMCMPKENLENFESLVDI